MVSKRGVGGFCEKYSPLSDSVAQIPVVFFLTFNIKPVENKHFNQLFQS